MRVENTDIVVIDNYLGSGLDKDRVRKIFVEGGIGSLEEVLTCVDGEKSYPWALQYPVSVMGGAATIEKAVRDVREIRNCGMCSVTAYFDSSSGNLVMRGRCARTVTQTDIIKK